MATTDTDNGPAGDPPGDGLTIDELARQSGMTARNIRAHQSRGLLPPPSVHARTGYYTPEHLRRIKLIQQMQTQGFNLKAIQRLLELGAGAGGPNALAFERAILAPFGDEEPVVISGAELAAIFGSEGEGKTLRKAEKIGAIRPLGRDRWEVPSPTFLHAASELVELGIPLSHGLAVGDEIRKHTAAIAREFVKLYVKDVLDPLREDGVIADDRLSTAREAVERLRPLASEAVMAGFNRTMTEAVGAYFEREVNRQAR